jgi:hypothetical protein
MFNRERRQACGLLLFLLARILEELLLSVCKFDWGRGGNWHLEGEQRFTGDERRHGKAWANWDGARRMVIVAR